MALVDIQATFPSAEQARRAIGRLRGSVNEAAIRAATARELRIRVPDTAVASVSGLLRDCGATALTAAQPAASPGWLSHQNGRVTGTGVEPGAGDAEAGPR